LHELVRVSESFLVSVKAQDHRSDPEMKFFVELYSTGAAATRALFTHVILMRFVKQPWHAWYL
jgi:hypothetical protein